MAEEAVGEAEFARALSGVASAIGGKQLVLSCRLRPASSIVSKPAETAEKTSASAASENVEGVKELPLAHGAEDPEKGHESQADPHDGSVVVVVSGSLNKQLMLCDPF